MYGDLSEGPVSPSDELVVFVAEFVVVFVLVVFVRYAPIERTTTNLRWSMMNVSLLT